MNYITNVCISRNIIMMGYTDIIVSIRLCSNYAKYFRGGLSGFRGGVTWLHTCTSTEVEDIGRWIEMLRFLFLGCWGCIWLHLVSNALIYEYTSGV